jgi:hypothetical protein
MKQVDGFVVYWMEQWHGEDNLVPVARQFPLDKMGDALQLIGELRKYPENQFVTMTSQNSNSVGKAGVDSVEDGKTPDGQEYSWSKASRAGRMRKGDEAGPKSFVEP